MAAAGEDGLWAGRSELQETSPRVFITNRFGAALGRGARERLRAESISHVLTVAIGDTASTPFTDELTYLQLDVSDHNGAEVPFGEAFDFIRGALEQSPDHHVCVHCDAGRSRSGAVVVAWKMVAEGLSFEAALEACQAVRPIIDVSNFEAQLRALEEQKS